MPRLSDEIWKEIAHKYKTDKRYSYSYIGKKYGVSPAGISKRFKRMGVKADTYHGKTGGCLQVRTAKLGEKILATLNQTKSVKATLKKYRKQELRLSQLVKVAVKHGNNLIPYHARYVSEHRGAILELFGKRCSGCERKLTFKTARIDHCHATGFIRGTLCHECNLLLGHLEILYADRNRMSKLNCYVEDFINHQL